MWEKQGTRLVSLIYELQPSGHPAMISVAVILMLLLIVAVQDQVWQCRRV
jgi:hypothetical protein